MAEVQFDMVAVHRPGRKDERDELGKVTTFLEIQEKGVFGPAGVGFAPERAGPGLFDIRLEDRMGIADPERCSEALATSRIVNCNVLLLAVVPAGPDDDPGLRSDCLAECA